MHGDGLADDEAIREEFTDRLARVRIADFAGFIGIEPDLALATVSHGGRKALLGAKIRPG